MPHDVSDTRNAYHAFKAVLTAFERFVVARDDDRIDTLVCPALCCVYGRMPAKESARQIADALRDFVRDHHHRSENTGEDKGDACAWVDGAFIGPSTVDEEQPDNFDCREIKTVDIGRMMMRRKRRDG